MLVLGGSSINTSPVLLTTVTDPLGNQTTYHFNPQSFLVDVTDALGRKTIIARDPATNNVLSITDPLNRVTTYTYDAVGNLTSKTSLAGTAGAEITSATYDPVFNKPLTITDELGHVTTMAYDPLGNLLSIADLSHTITFTYDGFGELLTKGDGLGNKIQNSYLNGSVASIKDPLGNVTSQTSDAVGRTLSITSPLGQTTRYIYDALNQVTQVTDPSGGVTAFSLDPNGNLLSLKDTLGQTTSYTYDFMDRPLTRKDPLMRLETYKYDLNGNLVSRIDRKSQATNFIYDALGRISFIGFNAVVNAGASSYESALTYTYDSGNRLAQVVDSAGGSVIRNYDSLDRLISETTTQGSITYGYDLAGRRTNMQIVGQPAVSYTYDNSNQLTQISQGTLTTTFTYDAVNRRSALAIGSGVNLAYSYDDDSRLVGISYKFGANTLGNMTYTYDSLGRRTQMGGTFARVGLPVPATANYDSANQLTNWNGTPIGYDQNGNMLSDGINAFTWNARNQVATLNGATLQYDAFGRRIKNASGRFFLYDGSNISEELSGSTALASNLTAGVDEIFTHTDASGSYTPLVDALGSTLALVDASGNLATQYSYDPFGNTTTSGNLNNNVAQYTGRENEGNGLYFYRARYYSPIFQRFISQDPLGFGSGDQNLYAYVGNNPTNEIDPSGQKRFCFKNKDGIFGNKIPDTCFDPDAPPPPKLSGRKQFADFVGELLGLIGAQCLDESNCSPFGLGPLAKPHAIGANCQPDLRTGIPCPSIGLAMPVGSAPRVGSALKADFYHIAAERMSTFVEGTGTEFNITGGNGAPASLLQVPGTVNGVAGRFEYIINAAGELTHQMFVPGGTINGIPIKP